MKSLLPIYFVFPLFITFSCFTFGQTLTQSRVANLVSGDYSTSGTVYLEAFDDNTVDVRFDNDYLTQSNVFDVHVFLTNNNNYTAPINVSNDFLVANIGTISGLNYSSGAMTFTLPMGVSIDDYDHLVFVCLSFGQLHWAHGDFSIYTPPVLTEFIATCDATPPTPLLMITNEAPISGISDIPFPITNFGTTLIEWTFDDGMGNFAISEQEVTVNNITSSINQAGNVLSANPGGDSFQWINCNNPSAPISGETSSSFIALTPGDYAAIITEGNCQATSSCSTVSFQDIYTPPILTEIVSNCETTPPTPTLALNDGSILSGTSNISFPITVPGTTSITWTFTDQVGNSVSSQQDVTINPLLISVNQTGNALEANSTISNFVWVDCDDNYAPVPGETNATFTAMNHGNYAVIAGTGNCYDTSSCYSVSLEDVYDAPVLTDIFAICNTIPPTPTLTLNDGTVIDGIPNVTFPINAIGNTIVTWTFDAGGGNALTSEQNITIEELVVSVNQTGNTLEASSTNSNFVWVNCDNNYTPIPGETTAIFTATSHGNYAVITGMGNCFDTSSCYLVSIEDISGPPVLVDIFAVCETVPPTPTLTLMDGTIINGTPNASFPINTIGNTLVTWTFDAGGGNTLTSDQNINIEALAVSVNQTGSTLGASSTSSNFIWVDCDDNYTPIPGETDAVFTATNHGNYAVIVETGSCFDTSSCYSISLEDLYDTPILDDVFSVCEATPLTPTLTLTDGTIINGIPNASFPINTIGNTLVTWTFDAGGGNTLTSDQNINIEALAVSVNQTGSTLGASSASSNFIWVDCDDNYAPIPGETDPSFTPTTGGNYAVIATSGNCRDTSSCFSVSIAGLHTLDDQTEIRLFPNPSNGDFTIGFEEILDKVQIQITDLTGRVILKKTYYSIDNIPMHINGPSSSYLVQVLTKDAISTFTYLVN